MKYEQGELHSSGSVVVLTLDDPGVLNALSISMLRGLGDALSAIEAAGSGVRCVVLTGAGRAFSSGANLTGTNPAEYVGEDGKIDLSKPMDEAFHPVLRRLIDLHCPLITAVNGVAAGGGMSLAIMGDLVLAARSATFVQAFRGIGLVPDCGSTFLLPRRVGWGRALELSLLGEKISAERGLEWGLVNRVFDDDQLMAEAMKLAAELAAGPTVALGLTRRAYWESGRNTFAEQLELEGQLQRVAGQTKDFAEGIAAFLHKRPARFEGA